MKKEFPFFEKTNNIYLDSASTTQKPKEVLDAINEYNEILNSNAGRGAYKLAFNSVNIMETCRESIKKYFNISSDYDVVFTKNATESINLIAYTYGMTLNKDDEIILCVNNHHANIVVWQYVAKIRNIKLIYIDITKEGKLDYKQLESLITPRTKLISISHIVNTTGIENDIEKVKDIIENKDIKLLLDISQTVAHRKISLNNIADFYVFSAHKMFASMGLGVLIGKKDILDEIPPFIYGGDMIEYVEKEYSTFKKSPYKFEGGTQNISAIYSLITAIKYLDENIDDIQQKEKELLIYTLNEMKKLDFIEIYNEQAEIPIIAFNIKNIHSHDVGSILDFHNISIRTGQHCTSLLMKALNISSCCRVSISSYNKKEDIDKLIYALKEVYNLFQVGCGV